MTDTQKPSVSVTPATETGRAMLAALEAFTVPAMPDAILAIENEAREQGRASHADAPPLTDDPDYFPNTEYERGYADSHAAIRADTPNAWGQGINDPKAVGKAIGKAALDSARAALATQPAPSASADAAHWKRLLAFIEAAPPSPERSQAIVDANVALTETNAMLRAAIRADTPPPLVDVERLNEAAAGFQVLYAPPGARYTVENEPRIRAIAAEYARLAADTEAEWRCTDPTCEGGHCKHRAAHLAADTEETP